MGRHAHADVEAPASPDISAPVGDVGDSAAASRRGRSSEGHLTVAQLRARLGQPAAQAPVGAGRRRAEAAPQDDDDHRQDDHRRRGRGDVLDADDLTHAAFAALIERLAEPDEPDAGAQPLAAQSYVGRRRAPEPTPGTTRPAGPRASTRPETRTAARRRRRLARLLPVVAAMFVVLLTTGAATATRLAFATDSPAAANGVDVAAFGSGDDTRVSRGKRTDLDLPDASTPAADAPAAGETFADPGAVPPLVLAGDGSLIPADAQPPVTEAPAPPPPPPPPVWVRPTEGGNMTSCFCTRWGTFHDGIDIDPPYGTPIVAVGDGVVVYSGPLSGYGIGIFIRHDNGDVSFYGHENTSYVSTGDTVTAGEEIAFVANEGFSTGPHLHFSVYQGWQSSGNPGTAIDPVPWLRDRGIEVGPYNPNG